MFLGLVGRGGRPVRPPADGAAGPDLRLGRREPVLRRAEAAGRLGYLDARKEPGKTRERTVYTLTEKGLAALREWAHDAGALPAPEARGARPAAARRPRRRGGRARGLGTLREDIADLSARLDVAEAVARRLPHRRKYLLLSHRLAAGCSSVHLEWLDEVERELESLSKNKSS